VLLAEVVEEGADGAVVAGAAPAAIVLSDIPP